MASKKSRLEAAAAEATKIFFSAADGGAEGGSEAAQVVEPVKEASKVSKVSASVIFSVRANAASVDDWKSYAKAKGLSMTEIVSKAMAEYQKRHTLTAEELETYKRELHKLELLKTL